MAALTSPDLAHWRLHNQRIAGPPMPSPTDVVQWLTAVQAQDYGAAKWALGLRSGATHAAVERACDEGAILRTHVLRPTWHFVSPADIRWLLELTAPRVHALNAYHYRRQELDDALFARSQDALVSALQGGNQLTRPETVAVLERAGIASPTLLRFGLILMHAELDGILCSGARRGKQPTYALLAERAPAARRLARDEALAELARRYFTAHGPATLQDYIWWSGLAAAEARAGLAVIQSDLIWEEVAGQTYWRSAAPLPPADPVPTAYLLPNFDEYVVGYTDRSAVFDPAHTPKLSPRPDILSNHTIVLDGRVAGTWRRTLLKNALVVEATPFTPLTEAETRAIARAAERFGAFLGLPVALQGRD